MSSNFVFNARPPENWMAGKTAASVRFVYEAQHYIRSSKCANEADKTKLSKAIAKVKKGEFALTKFTSPEEFLAWENSPV